MESYSVPKDTDMVEVQEFSLWIQEMDQWQLQTSQRRHKHSLHPSYQMEETLLLQTGTTSTTMTHPRLPRRRLAVQTFAADVERQSTWQKRWWVEGQLGTRLPASVVESVTSDWSQLASVRGMEKSTVRPAMENSGDQRVMGLVWVRVSFNRMRLHKEKNKMHREKLGRGILSSLLLEFHSSLVITPPFIIIKNLQEVKIWPVLSSSHPLIYYLSKSWETREIILPLRVFQSWPSYQFVA